MKSCLVGMVGLTRGSCECLPVDSGLKESKFNLFLDELEGIDLELINNSLGCGEELETNFSKKLENAANFLESDLQVEIAEHYKQKINPYTGRIGEQKYSAPLNSLNSAMAGMKLNTKTIRGASIVVKDILLYFSGAGQIDLKIYQGNDLIQEFDGIEIVNGLKTFTPTESIVLPLTKYGSSVDYYFVYEVPEGIKPMNNSTKCGCKGVEEVRNRFLSLKGVKGDDIDSLSTDNSYAMGISLNAYVGCSVNEMFCDLIDDEIVKRRVAIAMWYKLGVLTLEQLFSSRNINFDTLSNNEYLYTRKKKFESLYKSIIEWLAENILIEDSDCFICNSSKQMAMGKILL